MPLKPILRLSNPSQLLSASKTITIGAESRIRTTSCLPVTQTRHARLLKRPKRPYTFTQLLTLSDGSAYTIRTTSPLPVYRSTRDTRNAPLWNPSTRELLNVEADEAGRLAAFRSKFGRGWDASKETSVEDRTEVEKLKMGKTESEEEKGTAKQMADLEEEDDLSAEEDSLLDLISSYGQEDAAAGSAQSGQVKQPKIKRR